MLACGRRQLADEIRFSQEIFRQAAEKDRLAACAPRNQTLSNARVSRAGFGISPKQSFQKVRDRKTRALPKIRPRRLQL